MYPCGIVDLPGRPFSMNTPLSTYLHDHLAGADFAINLLQTMKEEHPDQGLRTFAHDLLESGKRSEGVAAAGG
jgi:hypothetical protein